MLPIVSPPSVLPATRTTNRSSEARPKSDSTGTWASEHPSTSPNGRGSGRRLSTAPMPNSPANSGTWSALEMLSAVLANRSLPAASHASACWPSSGSCFTRRTLARAHAAHHAFSASPDRHGSAATLRMSTRMPNRHRPAAASCVTVVGHGGKGGCTMRRLVVPVSALLLLLAATASCRVDTAAQAPAKARPVSPGDLDYLLAPVALYPDALLAQILLSAGTPAKVSQLSTWLAANTSLKGTDLQDAA